MTDHDVRPGMDASPGMSDSPASVVPDFVGRVMATVESSTLPSAPRSFLEATRDRSWREATSSLLVASHLVMHARTVPMPVRAQALALVAVIALLTGAGATLAATTAYRVAAPIMGLAGGEGRALRTPPPTSPTPAPLLPQPAIAAPPPADEPEGVFDDDAKRRPGAWRAGDDTDADSSRDDDADSGDPGAADQDDLDQDREDSRDDDGSDDGSGSDDGEDPGHEAGDASDDDPDDGSTDEADDETEDNGGDDGGSNDEPDEPDDPDEPDETGTPDPDDDDVEEPAGEAGD